MRVPMSEEADEDLSRYDRSRSLSIDSSSNANDEVASNASSVTLCFQHNGVKTEGTCGNRLASIENMLSAQQDTLQRLLSVAQDRLSPTPEPDHTYRPLSDCNLDEYYEQARIEAGFQDRGEWNAAYIHGLVRIGGQLSKSITLNPVCSRCAESRNVAVCLSLAEEDPYYEHLVINERTCCGWCEYEKIQCEEEHRPDATQKEALNPSDDGDSQMGGLGVPDLFFIEYSDQGKPQERNSIYFISGEGINREVITADIPRYLGIDALVRPGSYFNPKTAKSIEGFYIRAYRPPTTAMLVDLRADSKAWEDEKFNIVKPDAIEREREAKRNRQQYTLPQKPGNPYQTATVSNWPVYQTMQNCGQIEENKTPSASASTHGSQLASARIDVYEKHPIVQQSNMGERSEKS